MTKKRDETTDTPPSAAAEASLVDKVWSKWPEVVIGSLFGALLSGFLQGFELPVWVYGLALLFMLILSLVARRRHPTDKSPTTSWIVVASVLIGMLVGIGGVSLFERLDCDARVGRGDPAFTDSFKDSYKRAGGQELLGCPINEVHAWAGGVIQDFRGGSKGSGAIMALHPRRAIVLAGPLWRYYEAIGVTPGQGAYLAGYPASKRRAGGEVIRLTGGSCGDGLLALRRNSTVVRWVFGPIYVRYSDARGVAGRFGYPISAAQLIGRTRLSQRFEGGDIRASTGSLRSLPDCLG